LALATPDLTLKIPKRKIGEPNANYWTRILNGVVLLAFPKSKTPELAPIELAELLGWGKKRKAICEAQKSLKLAGWIGYRRENGRLLFIHPAHYNGV
jgi:hypothetical protein